MKMRHGPLVVSLLVALTPAVVSAQQGTGAGEPPPPEMRRPYRGIFSGLSTPRTPQSLVFSGALFGAYDDNVLEGLARHITRDWRLQDSGYYVGGQAGLDYLASLDRQRVDLGVNAGAHTRYYRHGELSSFVPEYRAGVDAGFELTKSTRLSLGHQFLYSQSYRFFGVSTFDDQEIVDSLTVIDPALDLLELAVVRNTSNVMLTQALGRYASFLAGYRLRSVDFRDDERPAGEEGEEEDEEGLLNGFLRDYSSQSVMARISYDRPLTRNAVLNLGYGIRVSESEQGAGEPRAIHDIRAGVSYSRALSFSRRTSLSFSTGSAVAVRDDLGETEAGSRTDFRITGNVSLAHELARTWTARATYVRGFMFREGYDEPFFTDAATVGIGGLLTRRLSFSALGRWSLSTLQRQGQTGHQSFSGTAQTTYALNSFLALFASYVYYKYDFEEDTPLDPRVPRRLDRQGVRVGITTSIPLLR